MTLASMSLALFGASMARSNLVVKVLTIQPPNRNRSDLWIFKLQALNRCPHSGGVRLCWVSINTLQVDVFRLGLRASSRNW
jgi:hypothetical protein